MTDNASECGIHPVSITVHVRMVLAYLQCPAHRVHWCPISAEFDTEPRHFRIETVTGWGYGEEKGHYRTS